MKKAVDIIERADRVLNGLESETIQRVGAVLDAAYNALEQQLVRQYPNYTAESQPNLLGNQRALLLADQLKDLLPLFTAQTKKQIQARFKKLLQTSSQQGTQLSSELMALLGGDSFVKSTATIPIEAIGIAADLAYNRLEKHGADFAGRATALITMGLTQGWGVQRVAREMRSVLGIAKGRAEVIVRTETMNALNGASQQNYQQNGIEQVQVIGTTDSRICRYCAGRNGNVYELGKITVPIHPRCRCYLAPFSMEWLRLGLTDAQWLEDFREEGIRLLAAQGQQPETGVSPFEKAAGMTNPPPVLWQPGQPIPGAAPAPAPAPTPTPRTRRSTPPASDFPDTLDDLELVQSLGGSTGARLMRDPATGRQFVWKMGNSPEHLQEEMLADAAYQALGVPVPKFRAYQTPGGPVKLSEFIEGRSLDDVLAAGGAEADRVRQELQKHLAADALLANWDVLGMAQDNVLIANDGTVYRIDNGGSLRFRAQGQAKGNAWNDYPQELWSLRKFNPDVFGDLRFSDLVKQIDAIDEAALTRVLPADVMNTVSGRLREMQRITGIAKTLEADDWNDSYISRFTEHAIGLRAAGIIGRLPQKLEQDKPGSVELVDENGKPFDDLRGPNSRMFEVERYIDGAGGSFAFLQDWMLEQSRDSWNTLPSALKYLLASQRSVPLDRYYWPAGPDDARQRFENAAKKRGEETLLTTLAAWHAWNYELLDAIDIAGKDAAAGTIKLLRTETDTVLQMYGINPGDRQASMTRGPAESTSLYQPVYVAGGEVTEQRVPLHRIVGMYFYNRQPGTVTGAFLNDSENEVLAMLEGIALDYTAQLDNFGNLAKVFAAPTKESRATSSRSKAGPHQKLVSAGRKAIGAKTRKALESLDTKRIAELQAEIDALQPELDRLIEADFATAFKSPVAQRVGNLELEQKQLKDTWKRQAASAMRDLREELMSSVSDEQIANLLAGVKINKSALKVAQLSEDELRSEVAEFLKLTGGRGAELLKKITKDSDRAYADDSTGTINLGYLGGSADLRRETLFHELGHFVEMADERILAASQAFIQARATADQKPLNEITGTTHYDADEVAYPGDFVHPYVGKDYGDATEVVSMALERFTSAERMLEFYEQDSEHFWLVIGALRS